MFISLGLFVRYRCQYAVFKVQSLVTFVTSGDKGIRTLDPLLARQVLSQLSYTPKAPGIHLSSHTVSSIVFSAAYGLTVVFGMGTGVSRKRIDTRNLLFSSFSGTLITEQRNEMSTSDRKKIRPYACITGCFSSWLVQYSTNTELRNAVPKKCFSLTFSLLLLP